MSNIDTEDEIEQAAEKIMGILTRDEPRKSFDSYAHPNTKERAKKGLLAVKPVQESTDKESLSVEIELHSLPATMKTCDQCGEVFEPYKNGCTRPNKCKDCMKANISDAMRLKNIKKKFQSDADRYAKDHPENLIFDDTPQTLTLTFTQKRDARVYEAICASAENDRRTPEN